MASMTGLSAAELQKLLEGNGPMPMPSFNPADFYSGLLPTSGGSGLDAISKATGSGTTYYPPGDYGYNALTGKYELKAPGNSYAAGTFPPNSTLKLPTTNAAPWKTGFSFAPPPTAAPMTAQAPAPQVPGPTASPPASPLGAPTYVPPGTTPAPPEEPGWKMGDGLLALLLGGKKPDLGALLGGVGKQAGEGLGGLSTGLNSLFSGRSNANPFDVMAMGGNARNAAANPAAAARQAAGKTSYVNSTGSLMPTVTMSGKPINFDPYKK